MNALYKKVVKGVYEDPPGHFSVDLKRLINNMITVRADLWPTCAQILTSREVQRGIHKWKIDVSYLGLDNTQVFANSQPANMRKKG